jgi:predicted hydrocarbon binding protein
MQAGKYFLSNRHVRVYLDAIAETSGQYGFPTVLTLAGLHRWLETLPPYNDAHEVDFVDFGALNAMLVKMYGPRAGRALALWAGRVSFMALTPHLDDSLNVKAASFQAQTPAERVRAVLDIIVDSRRLGTMEATLQSPGNQFTYTLDPCPFCFGQHRVAYPICHGAVGFLQQAVEWVGAGDYYTVEEASCAATKGSQESGCVFVILKMELHNDNW